MSCFAGVVRFDGAPVTQDDLNRLSAALDAKGVGAPSFWRGTGIGLVHRQRISTPEDRLERQPWTGWGGRGVVVFDGRLDDRVGLMSDLGSAAGSHPDAALVRDALERWGLAAPERLLGDFAFAWWDGENRRLILVRDAMGAQALYHYRCGDTLVFATTLRAMLALPLVERALDEGVLADLLVLNQRNPEVTVWRGVDRVAPATILTHDTLGMRSEVYWTPDPGRRLNLPDDKSYVEAARAELDRAVGDRLRSVEPVPILGSGGLDSSCLAVSAVSLSRGGRQKFLTLIPAPDCPSPAQSGQYSSEQSRVEAMAARFPALDVEFIPGGSDPLVVGESPGLRLAGVVPFRNVINASWFSSAYLRAAELGACSTIDGGFGFWTLTWDGLRGLGELFRTGRWLGLAREAWALGEGKPRRALGFIRREVVMPLLLSGSERSLDAWRRFSALSPAAATALDIEGRLRASGHDPSYGGSPDGRALRRYGMGATFGAAADMRAAIRAHWGVQIRQPLADRRLVEFCLAIPQDQYLRNGEPRHLARRILRAAGAPLAVSDNRGFGLQNPEWFSRLDRDQCAAVIEGAGRSALASHLLDIPRLRRLLETWPIDAEAAMERRREFANLLPRALHMASFIRWAEGGNQ